MAATNKGLYESTDFGKSFAPFTNGISADATIYDYGFFVATNNGMYNYVTDSNTYSQFINGGDFRTSVLDYTVFLGFAFGDGVAKKINLQTGLVDDVPLTNVTGGVILGCTVVKDYVYIYTATGGIYRIAKQGNLSTKDVTLLENSIDVFPNPTSGQFTIQSKKPGIFNLYTIQGKLLKSFSIQNSQKVNLNVSAGVYFLKGKEFKRVKKIIIK